MSLSAAAIRMMAEKGLSGMDIAEIAEANEPARSTGAVRQKRYRDSKKRNERDVTRDVTSPSNEETSNSLVSPSANADRPPAFENRVVEAWNAGAEPVGLPQSRSLNPKRRASLKARVHEHGEQAVFEAIRNTCQSKFHCGENDRGWKADLGWLLTSPEKFQKMLEAEPAPRPAASAHSALFASANRMRKAA